MERPKIKIQANRIDYMFEIIATIGLIGLIILPIVFYGALPEMVPKHFDIQGTPDAYGSKGMVWFLPIIGIIMYIGLTILSKYPHLFNYPTKVTTENARSIYKKGILVIRILKIALIYLFIFFTLKIIGVGVERLDKLPELFLPIMLIAFFGMILFLIIWMSK